MSLIPFFGSDDDDDEPATIEEIGDLTITSNRSDPDINVTRVDEEGVLSAPEGLTVHTISIGESSATSGSAPSTVGTGPSSTPGRASPEAPATPGDTPTPTADPYARGTFAIPEDKHFLQKLEARGKNGHGAIVETVYVLTGPTYTQPTDLVRLDNEEYFGSATRSSVQFDPDAMAEKVASLYPTGESPNLIARFHTHPGGSLTPSSADQQSAPKVRQAFVDAFDTDEFEFFHGLHALDEHERSPNPDDRQKPETRGPTVQWLGERYRHKLAVFGRGFKSSNQKEIAIHGGG